MTAAGDASDDGTERGQAEILAWLDAFASCVQDRDVVRGRSLFDADCQAFGTRNAALEGLDDLAELQWRPTWLNTHGFRFLAPSIRISLSADGSLAAVAALWTSAIDAAPAAPPRDGRATFVLRHHGAWTCLHSHLSYTPLGTL